VKTKFLTKEDVGSAKMKTSKVLQLAEDGLNPDCMKKVKDPKLKADLLKFEDESVRASAVVCAVCAARECGGVCGIG
jgi:hypothetical protein